MGKKIERNDFQVVMVFDGSFLSRFFGSEIFVVKNDAERQCFDFARLSRSLQVRLPLPSSGATHKASQQRAFGSGYAILVP